jgi:hypothetical protein
MVSLVIVAVLVGVVIGLRLKYQFLIFSVAVVVAAIAGVAVMRRSGVERTMLEMVLAAAALQAGYLCGAIGIAAARKWKAPFFD